MLRLKDSGSIQEGMWADIVVFDAEKIADTATYENPHQYPVGIDHVIVNGAIIVEKGEHTGKLPGEGSKAQGKIT